MNCPHCGRGVEAAEGHQTCPYCGEPLSKDAAPLEGQTDASPRASNDGSSAGPGHERNVSDAGLSLKYCPWEDQDHLGFIHGMGRTLQASMFRPTFFFSRLPRSGGFVQPLLFALIIETLATMFSLMWAFAGDNPVIADLNLSQNTSIFVGVLIPLYVFLAVVMWAAILHGTLVLLGSGSEGFEATFRVACYSSGPELANILPVVGGFIALGWKIHLTVIGLREVQQITTRQAVLVILLPILLLCGAGMTLLALAGVQTVT